MASIAISAVVNTISFTGALYLFKMLDGDKCEKEMECHNKAVEQLAKSKECGLKMKQRKKMISNGFVNVSLMLTPTFQQLINR